MKLHKKFASYSVLVLLFSLLIPCITHARVLITEIMYDPAGTDTSREWVEVANDGADAVDLSGFRVVENNVAHTMKAFSGPDAILPAGAYAIIADNTEKFMVDYPNFLGLLIDSAFSLNNTGESISIKHPDGSIDSSVDYLVEWGAAGTGNSLQLNNNIWIPASPTVGIVNATQPADETPSDANSGSNTTDTGTSTSSSSSSSSTDTTSSHSSQTPLSTYKPKIIFEVTAGRNRYGFVNTPIQFVADHNQEKKSGIRYLWSTGDGDFEKKRTIEHTYIYEGEYNVVLNSSFQGKQAVARNKITIRTPQITAKMITRGKLVDIMLENSGEFEVNLGGYEIEIVANGLNDRFEFPQDTIISAKKSVTIPSEITGFESEIALNILRVLYPNGYDLFTSHSESPPPEKTLNSTT